MPEVMPPELMIFGVPLVLVVAVAVEGLKRLGMATQWAGAAAIAVCGVVVGLVELQSHPTLGGVATWALMSLVYGLASAGAYSQFKKLTGRQ